MSVQDSMVAVKYVGRKSVKYDTVCHTRTTWTPGSTRPVGPEVAGKLLAFPDIWIEGNRKEIDLPSAATPQQSVAPMAPPKAEKPAEPTGVSHHTEAETQAEPPEPEPEEDFNPTKLLAKAFLALKNALPNLTDAELDQVNTMERSVKKRPGFIRAIQDELEKRAG